MHTPDIGLRYRALVSDRRRLGDERYGARHLARSDLAANCVEEVVDAVVYLTLAARAWAASSVPPSVALEQRLARLVRDAIRLGERCCVLAEPGVPPEEAFAHTLRERFQFGESRYGDAYLQRENLGEALEEIADCQILVELERERHRHLTGRAHPREQLLQEIADRCHGLGELTLAAHAARAKAALPNGTRADPAWRRAALLAEREALSRLLERTRRLLLAARPRAQEQGQPSPARRPGATGTPTQAAGVVGGGRRRTAA
jgi:hypothetical protein